MNQFAQAQDIAYAKRIINTLGDSSFHGRGYVNNGDSIAASYIQDQFESLGIQKIGQDYIQKFDVSVNTLPGKLELSVNGNLLTPGVDFLVDPSSPSFRQKAKTFYLPNSAYESWIELKNSLLDKAKKILVIENIELSPEILYKLKNSTDIELGGIAYLTDKKLTWHTSVTQAKRPFITIKKEIKSKVKRIDLNVEAEYFSNYRTQNVIGKIQGKSDSLIVLSAHYDHLGRMGTDTYFPGANDNASGIALMLDLGRYFVKNKQNYSIVLMAFGGEELGLLGSSFFVKDPLFALNKIKFMLNFDISGTGDDGIQVVNGSIFREEFKELSQINLRKNLLKAVKIRGESCNSDHCPFYRNGVPSFFIYTLGGIQAYHDIYDKPETLPLTAYENYFKLLTIFINQL